ncbi:hypothetical protein BKA83DRAFT_4485929 [Pisolithus microcarpus]|nr:hypothetical protein BKA83DRAFT_4485929 [Pisolithus microcarpus]
MTLSSNLMQTVGGKTLYPLEDFIRAALQSLNDSAVATMYHSLYLQLNHKDLQFDNTDGCFTCTDDLHGLFVTIAANQSFSVGDTTSITWQSLQLTTTSTSVTQTTPQSSVTTDSLPPSTGSLESQHLTAVEQNISGNKMSYHSHLSLQVVQRQCLSSSGEGSGVKNNNIQLSHLNKLPCITIMKTFLRAGLPLLDIDLAAASKFAHRDGKKELCTAVKGSTKALTAFLNAFTS